MRFLIDENLPPELTVLARSLGQEAIHVRDADLRGASDDSIAEYARRNGLCIITLDGDFADVRRYPPGQYAGIVVVTLAPDATISAIRAVFESLFRTPEVLRLIPGRLAIVEPGRVRLRPAE